MMFIYRPQQPVCTDLLFPCQAIAYEWGAASHRDHHSRSPDENSQHQIASAMSNFAGKFPSKHYPVGRMNDLVYPVSGGMEDWGYAGKSSTFYLHNSLYTALNYNSYTESQHRGIRNM